MKLTALILEDEMKGRQVLKHMISMFCPDVEIVAESMTVAEAIPKVEEHKPDIVFLDIELPDKNGFILLESFPNPGFEVIFTTAYEKYAVQAFQIAALDYLLKPIDYLLLRQAIQKVKQRQQDKSLAKRWKVARDNMQQAPVKRLVLPNSDGYSFTEIDDIIACEASRNYTSFYLNNGKKLVVSKPLKFYEGILCKLHFYRIHRSYIINLNYLDKYIRTKNGEVVLKNGMVFTLSENRKDDFLKKINVMHTS